MNLGILGCLIAIIGLFLPFASVNGFGQSVSINYIDRDGSIVIITLIIAAIFLFTNKGKKRVITCLMIGLIITLYDGYDASRLMDTDKLQMFKAYINIKLEVGFYLTVIGHIVALIGVCSKEQVVVQPSMGMNQQDYIFNPQMMNYPQQPYNNGQLPPMNIPNNGVSYSWENNNYNNNQSDNF